MNVLINSVMKILSYVSNTFHISNQDVVHFKRITILFVSYTSVKLRGDNKFVQKWQSKRALGLLGMVNRGQVNIWGN